MFTFCLLHSVIILPRFRVCFLGGYCNIPCPNWPVMCRLCCFQLIKCYFVVIKFDIFARIFSFFGLSCLSSNNVITSWSWLLLVLILLLSFSVISYSVLVTPLGKVPWCYLFLLFSSIYIYCTCNSRVNRFFSSLWLFSVSRILHSSFCNFVASIS